MLTELETKFTLPAGSLFMTDNYSQKENSLISHTIAIWEASMPPMKDEVPTQNALVMTIKLSKAKSRPDDLDLYVRDDQETALHAHLPSDAEILEKTKSDIENKITRVRINKSSPFLVGYLKQNTVYAIENYVSKEPVFNCCSRYEECSDVKKCVHSNMLFSRACMYRKNIEDGKIFYGKNRNI